MTPHIKNEEPLFVINLPPDKNEADEVEVKITTFAKIWLWIQTYIFQTHKNCVMPGAVDRARAKAIINLVKNTNPIISYKYLGRPLGGTVIAIVMVAVGMSAMPQHDIIKDPNYWWECLIFQCDLFWLNMSSNFFLATTAGFMNLNGVFNIKHWVKVWAAGVFSFSLSWIVTRVAWVYGIFMRYPIPMGGIFNSLIGFAAQVLCVLYYLPPDMKKMKTFKRRVVFVMILHFYIICLSLFYWFYWFLFTIWPIDMQLVLAIALPIIREGLSHLIFIIGKECAGKHIPSVEFYGVNLINLFHTLFLSTCVGSVATLPTTVTLLGTDFAIKVYLLFDVFRKHGKEEWKECGVSLMSLTLNSFLEIFVPMSYILSFVAVFYGSNAGIMGNVKNSYWHYIGMSTGADLWNYSKIIVIMMGIDTAFAIIATLSLRWKCKIDMIQVYCFQAREFGSTLAIQQSYIIMNMFCSTVIGCAIDFTLKFLWVGDGFVIDDSDKRFSSNVNLTWMDDSLLPSSNFDLNISSTDLVFMSS